MPWFCVPSKTLVALPEPVASPEPLTQVVSAEPTAPLEQVVLVKKSVCTPCSNSCCMPLSCCKKSQPLVLTSTPPAETKKSTVSID